MRSRHSFRPPSLMEDEDDDNDDKDDDADDEDDGLSWKSELITQEIKHERN